MGKLLKISAIYSITSSLCMIVFWILNFIFNFHNNEISISSVSFWFLLIAEAITCIGLFVSGIGIIFKKKWGLQVYYISMGMLLYAVIYATGLFVKNGNIYLSELFILVTIATAIFLIIHLLIKKD